MTNLSFSWSSGAAGVALDQALNRGPMQTRGGEGVPMQSKLATVHSTDLLSRSTVCLLHVWKRILIALGSVLRPLA